MLQSLIPTPLHPAVVHLPIALTVLLPLFALGAFVAVRRGARPIAAWGITVAVATALTLSTWLAVESGEQQGERVERIVSEAPLEAHEEAAEAFLMLSLGMTALAFAGLARGKLGTVTRAVGVVGAVALAGAGWNVGHSGGQLVYRYGAASAYTSTTPDLASKAEPHSDDR